MFGSKIKRYPFIWIALLLVLTSVVCNSSSAVPTLSPTATESAAISLSPTALSSPTKPPSATSEPAIEAEPSTPDSGATDQVTEIAPIPSPSPTIDQAFETVRFAVIGDYGSGDQNEADVANLVKSWNPDLIITTGDNNYDYGAAETIDQNIGQFYHEFIYPYQGIYGQGADTNRFFPSLGNHDWYTLDGDGMPYPYLDYFKLPQRESGNERYYDFEWGPVHFFALDSDSREPDGVGRSSIQAAWLQSRLAESTAPWKIVYGHHPPYSSGLHGSIDWMRWPFAEWGATAYLAGHDHTYERLVIDGFPYFINGLGGGRIYYFNIPLDGSQVRYNGDYGAMLVEATKQEIIFQFINRSGEVIDTYMLVGEPVQETHLFAPLIRFESTDATL
jgi:hypothetical protein